MNKLLIALAFIFTTTTAQAESKDLLVSLPCDTFVNVLEIMENDKERLMFIGDTAIRETTTGQFYKAGLYVWMNLDTQTSSITIMFPDTTMCLLATNTSFHTYQGDQPWDRMKLKDDL
jgi:hypothetical protein